MNLKPILMSSAAFVFFLTLLFGLLKWTDIIDWRLAWILSPVWLFYAAMYVGLYYAWVLYVEEQAKLKGQKDV